MSDKVRVTVEPRSEANLRKLARALIALVEQSENNKPMPETLPEAEVA